MFDVKKQQQSLNKLGYLCGAADGLNGPRTRDAIRRFQDSWNYGPALSVDGKWGPKTQAAMDKTLKAGGKISDNFKSKEFQCKCNGGFKACPGIAVERADVAGLEQYRANLVKAKLVKSLLIVSATRCSGHNKKVGGATASRHLVGDGFDVAAVVPVDSKHIPARFKGQGYRARDKKVRHIDSRPTKARWRYSS